MNRIKSIAKHASIQAAMVSFEKRLAEIVDLAVAVQQIPAPTFAEEQRANFVQARFEAIGLQDVFQDGLHNVYGRYPAHSTVIQSPVVLSAHIDTVFSRQTDLTAKRDGRYVYGPGIGDNATGVAGLLWLAQTLPEFALHLPADVWFVANVGEEGLGDLRGMRAVVDYFGPKATYIVVEGGLYGQISHEAIGVRRFRVQVETPGGHSWGSFGTASAIHELGQIITAIKEIPVPSDPKTTFNVGVIEGGTSINSIAQSARLLLDLRSEDVAELGKLIEGVEAIVASVHEKPDVSVAMTLIGERPAGQIPRQTPLVQWAEAALRYVGCPEVTYIAGSTDANVPLSQGLTAVCVGLTKSGNAHRLDEYMDPTFLPAGLSHLFLLTLAAANF